MDYTSDSQKIIEGFQSRITQASRLMESGKYEKAISELEKIQTETRQYNFPQISTLIEKSLKNANLFKNLAKMFRVSSRLKIDDICGHLKLSRVEILDIFFDWGEKFGVNIDGDFISIKNIDNHASTIMDLPQHSLAVGIDEEAEIRTKMKLPTNSLMLEKYNMDISLGDHDFEQNDYNNALKHYNEAKNIAENELFKPDLVILADEKYKEIEYKIKINQKNKLISMATMHDKNGDYNEAKSNWKQILDTFSENEWNKTEQDILENSEIYFNLGLTLYNLEEYDECIKNYNMVTELNPNSALAYNNLGLSLEKLGRYIESIKKYEKALEIDPNFAPAYNNLGFSLYKLGRYKEAIEKYKKAIKIDTNFALAYNNLGFSLYKSRNYFSFIEVEEKFKKAVEIDPNFASAYNNLGYSQIKRGYYSDAIEKFEKALEINPNFTYAYIGFGIALFSKEKFDEAIKKYERALEIDPNSALAYHYLGRALEKLGKNNDAIEKFKKALDNFQKAIKLNPSKAKEFEDFIHYEEMKLAK